MCAKWRVKEGQNESYRENQIVVQFQTFQNKFMWASKMPKIPEVRMELKVDTIVSYVSLLDDYLRKGVSHT
jgi:hypothetical protein